MCGYGWEESGIGEPGLNVCEEVGDKKEENKEAKNGGRVNENGLATIFFGGGFSGKKYNKFWRFKSTKEKEN